MAAKKKPGDDADSSPDLLAELEASVSNAQTGADIDADKFSEIVASAFVSDDAPNWDDNGNALAMEIRAFIHRFARFPTDAILDLLVLWIFHTHVRYKDGSLAQFSTPRLAIMSEEKGSGKTRVLELVRNLCYKGKQVLDPTAATLANSIAVKHETVCMDELDLFLGKGAGKKDVRSFMNGGYRRGNFWERQRGGETVEYDVFGCMAFAGLMSTFMTHPGVATTRDRSIVAVMRKQRAGNRAEPWRERLNQPTADGYRESLYRWGQEHAIALAESEFPTMPEGIDDRLADIWEPLFQVAEYLGGDWPDRAANAAITLALSGAGEDEGHVLTPQQLLLFGMFQVFRGSKNLPTTVIIDRLMAMPDSPFAAMWRGMSKDSIADEMSIILRSVGVKPKKVHITAADSPTGAAKSLQGYPWAALSAQIPPDVLEKWQAEMDARALYASTEDEDGESAPIEFDDEGPVELDEE